MNAASNELRDLAWYGTQEARPAVRTLNAGRLRADLVDGGLRNIRYDGIEAVRAIAYLVRDENWGTYAPMITGLTIAEDDAGFRVTYQASCRGSDGRQLDFAVDIEADATGRLRFEARYHALTDFQTCRNGFCVLHPIEGLAGHRVTVEHTNGVIEDTIFPALIDPQQPIKDIRALTHALGDGLTVSCRFDGDVFEMEDHRNWSDASFKTYVRPLALPWPYRIAQGDGGEQAVELRIEARGPRRTAAPCADEPVVLSLASSSTPLPQIGLLVTPEDSAAVLTHIDELRALAPQALLFHFDPTAGHGLQVLHAYAAIVARYRCRHVFECVLPGKDEPARELGAIATLLEASGFAPEDIAVSPAVDRQSVPPGSVWPPCPPLDTVYRAARASFPGRAIGGGSFSYFTELNRKRPPLELLDWVTHATNPIVHAADDTSVMQTLEALPHITRSCRAIIGDKPYRIGPVTLAMRQNPYGSHTVDNPRGRRIPMANSDPRSRGLFGAAWLLGYAAQVAPAAPEVLTLGPLTGPRGLIDTATGRRHPAFRIAAALAALAGQEMIACRSSKPDKLLGLGGRATSGVRTLWVSNLTGQAQLCRVDGLAAESGVRLEICDGDLTHLGHRNRDEAAAVFELPPYACARFNA